MLDNCFEICLFKKLTVIISRRKGVLTPAGGEIEDPLGLDVENSNTNFPEDQLQEMFPESNGDIGSERFDPAYFLLEHHHATTFDDLKVSNICV